MTILAHAPPRSAVPAVRPAHAIRSTPFVNIVETWRRHRRAFLAPGDDSAADTYAAALRLELRSRIAVLTAWIADESDRRLRLQCLLELADGVDGLEEDIAEDVQAGHAWIATFAMQVVAGLVRANAGR